MKNNILKRLALCAAAFAVASCIDPSTPQPAEGEGTLAMSSVDISHDTRLKGNVVTRAAATRVGDSEIDRYRVVITAANGEVAFDDTYATLRERLPMRLNVGDYTLKVESHTAVDSEWERVHYSAEKHFSIEKGRRTDLEKIVCKISGILVSVRLGSKLTEAMTATDRCNVNVKIGDGSLDYGMTDGTMEMRRGIFRFTPPAGEPAEEDKYNFIVWTFDGTIEGVKYFGRETVKARAGEHHTFTFNTQRVDKGNGKFDLTVSAECEVYNINLNVDVEEEPIIEPFVHPVKLSSEMDLTARTTVKKSRALTPEGAAAIALAVKVEAEKGLRSLAVELTTDNAALTAALASQGLAGEIDLATVDGAGADALRALGLPLGADVTGKTELTLDFAKMLPMLFGTAPAFGDIDKLDVKITATDAGSFSTTATMMLKTFDDTGVPVTIEGDGFDIDEEKLISTAEVNRLGEGEKYPLMINLTVPKGIAKFIVTITSPVEPFMTVLDGTFHLVPDFDLVNPSEEAKGSLRTLNLPFGEAVAGVTNMVFDLSEFVPMMILVGDDFSASFKMDIHDRDGNIGTKTLKVRFIE